MSEQTDLKIPLYESSNPLAAAIERGYKEWADGTCHEISCGCMTVPIYEQVAPLFYATLTPGGAIKILLEFSRRIKSEFETLLFRAEQSNPVRTYLEIIHTEDYLQTALQNAQAELLKIVASPKEEIVKEN